MNDDELAGLLKYSSPNEIYIVTYDNVLILLICPFKVVVLVNIDVFNKGDFVFVDKVKITPELKTVFIINKKAYYYFYFDFIID